jgi:ribosomal protein S18 acetylase RimI-like enzyme
LKLFRYPKTISRAFAAPSISLRGSGAIWRFWRRRRPNRPRAFVLNNIAQGYPQLVVLSGGEVVGWCDILPKSRPVHAHVGVLGVALLPEFRGCGLGGRLVRQTLDAARAFGLHRVEPTVREDNKNVIALYRKIGFEIEALMRDAIKVDDIRENVVLMALLL